MGETKKDILVRLYVVYALVCVMGLAIVYRIWHIQNVKGGELIALADSLTTKDVVIQPSRGNIYSSDGSLLATSVPTYDLYVDLQLETITNDVFSNGLDSLAQGLSRILGDRGPSEYKALLRDARRPGPGKRYFPLKKNVSHAQLQQLYKLPVFRMGRYKGGLISEVKNKRVKPFTLLAERTIGYKIDGVGGVGIEGSFDDYLKGNTGMRLMQKISGNVWKPLNDENEIEPQDGQDVITTIDLNLQDVAESSLERQLIEHKAEMGCAVLMEVSTGAILAIANLKRDEQGRYKESYNLAVGQSTEPGSTFKLASMMALMEDGFITPDDSVDTQGGQINYYGKVLKDSKDGGYGRISMQGVFEQSSNVGVSKMVQKYYQKSPGDFVSRVKSFGLTDSMGLQVAGEGAPYINNVGTRYWSKLALPIMSIGYECKFTPLQLLTFYNAVANNGKMVRPLFVREIRNKGVVTHSFQPMVMREKIASDKTLSYARQMLEGVVQNGTASRLKHAQYKIAGKTGTAVIASNASGYEVGKKKYQASFVGYFPADKPRYSCIVVVYAPNNNLYYASQVAAPIFKDIADKVYSTSIELHPSIQATPLVASNLPSVKQGNSSNTIVALKGLDLSSVNANESSEWVSCVSNGKQLQLQPKKIAFGTVPDVIGMGLRDALQVLENAGLQIRVAGRGAVRNQSIPPGTKIEKGKEIFIQLG